MSPAYRGVCLALLDLTPDDVALREVTLAQLQQALQQAFMASVNILLAAAQGDDEPLPDAHTEGSKPNES